MDLQCILLSDKTTNFDHDISLSKIIWKFQRFSKIWMVASTSTETYFQCLLVLQTGIDSLGDFSADEASIGSYHQLALKEVSLSALKQQTLMEG